jgi:autotransporter adhesin
VGQVQAAIADANGYTNSMFGKAAQQTWSVAAVSQALSNLPQAPEPGKSMIGFGLGFSHGETGMAIGGSYYMPDDTVIIKASASYGGQAGLSAGMGAGFVLN